VQARGRKQARKLLLCVDSGNLQTNLQRGVHSFRDENAIFSSRNLHAAPGGCRGTLRSTSPHAGHHCRRHPSIRIEIACLAHALSLMLKLLALATSRDCHAMDPTASSCPVSCWGAVVTFAHQRPRLCRRLLRQPVPQRRCWRRRPTLKICVAQLHARVTLWLQAAVARLAGGGAPRYTRKTRSTNAG